MEVTTSELFDEYERDFASLCKDVEGRLDEETFSALNSHERSKSLTEAVGKLKAAEKALKQMEFEARTLPTEQRSVINPKMLRYRQQLQEQRKQVDSVQETHSRAILMGGDDSQGGVVYGKSMQDRQRLMDSSDLMQQSTNKLRDARRQAAETEQIGADVMTDLRQQRETIMRTKRNVHEVGSNYGMAKQMLDAMTRRAAANRAVTMGAMILMGIMVCILAASWLGIIGSGGGSSTATQTTTTTLRAAR
mmetsp:Transcript_36069/g.82840  ORF Transcript_36069/g.82840 Transcript_36069/m.82840 type:complete len:249 (-) Transcript_36069:51-797(-)